MWTLLDALMPYLLVGSFILLIVLAINVLGKRLEKHDQWLHRLDLRLQNLHKEKRQAYLQSLQAPPGNDNAGPPPLSEAKTLEVSEEMLETLVRQTRKDGGKR